MTIWPLEHVVCFSSPYCRSFIAPRLSTAYFIFALGALALVFFPILAAFASDNFWVKEGTYREQPLIRFAHDALLVLSGGAGGSAPPTLGWGTRRELSSLLPPDVRVPVVRSSAEDRNHDGLPDTIKLRLEMPTGDIRQGYQHVFLVAVFTYELREKVRTSMQGLVVVDATAAQPGTGVWLRGSLELKQKLPMRVTSEVRTAYSQNPLDIDWTSNWAAAHHPVNVRAVLERYLARNETIRLALDAPPIWDYSPRDAFEVEVEIDVHPQVVAYVPALMEMLKFAWVQVLSMLVPTYVVVRVVQAFAFESQVIETHIVSHLPELRGST